MSRIRCADILAPLIVSAGLLWSGCCRAALGGDTASVMADQAAVGGEISSSATPWCQIRQVESGSGLRVREYLDGGGKVFAVSWSGPVMPDLRPLLGAYYGDYTAALLKLKPLGLRRAVRIATAAFNVELGGHLRAYAGRAYLPARLPAGAVMGEIK